MIAAFVLTALALHGDAIARTRLIAAADGLRVAAMRSGHGIVARAARSFEVGTRCCWIAR